MATTEPLTGATVYQQTDAALGGQQLGDVVTDIVPYTLPRFTSTSTRDSAYATWVAAGNSLVAGLHCSVAGNLMRYNGTMWRYVGHLEVTNMAARPVGTQRYVGLRIQPQDAPSTIYTWTTSNVWIPDRWPLGNPTGIPSGAYMVIEGDSTVTSTNAAGAYSLPFPAMAAAPGAAQQTAGDTTGGLGFVVPSSGSYTSTGITGIAYTPSGGLVVSQPLIRVNWQAFGYRT